MRKTAFSPFSLLILAAFGCGEPDAPAQSSSASRAERDCAALCQRLDTCSSGVDEADCVERCTDDRASNPKYLSLSRTCAEDSSCDEFETGGDFADCVGDGISDIELSDTGQDFCAEAADRSSCNALDADELRDACESTLARYYADDFLAELEPCFQDEECADIAECVDDVADAFDAFEGAAQAFGGLFTPVITTDPTDPGDAGEAGAGGSASVPEGDAGDSAGGSSDPNPTCAHKPWNSTSIDSFENPAPEIGGERYSFLDAQDPVLVAPSLLDGSYALHSTGAGYSGLAGGVTLWFDDCMDASSFAGFDVWAMSGSRLAVEIATFSTHPVEFGGSCTAECISPFRVLAPAEQGGVFSVAWSEVSDGSAPLDPSEIIGLRFFAFKPEGETSFDWDFWIDDVEFF